MGGGGGNSAGGLFFKFLLVVAGLQLLGWAAAQIQLALAVVVPSLAVIAGLLLLLALLSRVWR